MSSKSIVFAGTPDFAAQLLEHLINHHPGRITHVISQQDKPRGRGQKSSPSPVKKIAIDQNIPVHTPASKEELDACINTLKPDLLIVAAYGMILPKSITDNYLCVNVHASLLPKYRGASPIQAALLNNDPESGITLIKMNEKMDEGDMILTEKVLLEPTTNFEVLYNLLVATANNITSTYITDYFDQNKLPLTPQPHNKASYCKKLTKEDFKLNPTDSPKTKLAKIKAFSPYPGAFILNSQNEPIKILDAQLDENNELTPTLIKPPGKGKMTYESYCLGNNERITL